VLGKRVSCAKRQNVENHGWTNLNNYVVGLGHMTCSYARRCTLGIAIRLLPIWGTIPQKIVFGDVNRHFQAKVVKYQHLHIMETAASIPTKFGTVINITKSWVVEHAHNNSKTADHFETRMWANVQRDGRPAEHRWRPLFNAAKFG